MIGRLQALSAVLAVLPTLCSATSKAGGGPAVRLVVPHGVADFEAGRAAAFDQSWGALVATSRDGRVLLFSGPLGLSARRTDDLLAGRAGPLAQGEAWALPPVPPVPDARAGISIREPSIHLAPAGDAVQVIEGDAPGNTLWYLLRLEWQADGTGTPVPVAHYRLDALGPGPRQGGPLSLYGSIGLRLLRLDLGAGTVAPLWTDPAGVADPALPGARLARPLVSDPTGTFFGAFVWLPQDDGQGTPTPAEELPANVDLVTGALTVGPQVAVLDRAGSPPGIGGVTPKGLLYSSSRGFGGVGNASPNDVWLMRPDGTRTSVFRYGCTGRVIFPIGPAGRDAEGRPVIDPHGCPAPCDTRCSPGPYRVHVDTTVEAAVDAEPLDRSHPPGLMLLAGPRPDDPSGEAVLTLFDPATSAVKASITLDDATRSAFYAVLKSPSGTPTRWFAKDLPRPPAFPVDQVQPLPLLPDGCTAPAAVVAEGHLLVLGCGDGTEALDVPAAGKTPILGDGDGGCVRAAAGGCASITAAPGTAFLDTPSGILAFGLGGASAPALFRFPVQGGAVAAPVAAAFTPTVSGTLHWAHLWISGGELYLEAKIRVAGYAHMHRWSAPVDPQGRITGPFVETTADDPLPAGAYSSRGLAEARSPGHAARLTLTGSYWWKRDATGRMVGPVQPGPDLPAPGHGARLVGNQLLFFAADGGVWESTLADAGAAPWVRVRTTLPLAPDAQVAGTPRVVPAGDALLVIGGAAAPAFVDPVPLDLTPKP